MKLLEEFGINIMQSVAGLFGALLFLGKEGAKNLKQTFLSLITGVASANYLTPVVVEMMSIENSSYSNGVAFLLGYVGLKGVEKISAKFFKNDKDNANTSSN